METGPRARALDPGRRPRASPPRPSTRGPRRRGRPARRHPGQHVAPEQARGAIDQLDVRTDVFALGAVLYEILTGRPPYQGATPTEVVLLAAQGVIPPGARQLAVGARGPRRGV